MVIMKLALTFLLILLILPLMNGEKTSGDHELRGVDSLKAILRDRRCSDDTGATCSNRFDCCESMCCIGGHCVISTVGCP
uniref:Conotoxin Im11.14 n=1 Tax=Conus imperialis TaxID=35631 RepID=F6LPM7_CONIM|nr:conotoxin Im11.14 [Conus imperialis]